MSTQGLLVSLVIMVLGLAWIVYPLFSREVYSGGKQALVLKQYGELQRRYAQTITAIRELDEDHATGKISSEEYEVERQRRAQQGVEVLKAIDNMGKNNPALKPAASRAVPKAKDVSIDDAIEDAVAQYLKKS